MADRECMLDSRRLSFRVVLDREAACVSLRELVLIPWVWRRFYRCDVLRRYKQAAEPDPSVARASHAQKSKTYLHHSLTTTLEVSPGPGVNGYSIYQRGRNGRDPRTAARARCFDKRARGCMTNETCLMNLGLSNCLVYGTIMEGQC